MSVADVALTPIQRGLGFSFAHYSVKSILVFLRVVSDSTTTMPMLILDSDSVADLKLKIQTVCNEFRVTRQRLVFCGRELARNASRARDYGVTDNSVLHLVLKKLCDPLLVTVVTACGKVFDFHVDRRRDVGYLKKRISKEGSKGFLDVDEQEIFFRGERLDDNRVLGGICGDGNSVIHLLLKKTVKDFLLEPLILNPAVKLPQVIEDMIDRTVDGLKKGNLPVRSAEGTGGTYLMQDSSGLKYVSVFKPMDEEPMAVNNPQQLPLSSDGQGLKRGTRVGEGAIREVAAYLLDHPKNGPGSQVMGFAGVPPTAMVRSFHKVYNNPKGVDSCSTKDAKVGSLQINLTPYQIGSMMCRETVNKDSVIEEIVREAHNSVLPASNEATFLEAVSMAMERRLDELTK
ncbi:hypothetical protein BRARA_I01320 [Brassica rapa]|uniref:1-phosphatidylinositol 4-kinase n=1 Tax=Brassica campestris TaxID=3711 RepID=A0A397XYK9_BRACM|nr:hypothetical protein BRARA_I01320 [Brassica rapa]